jgi:hypothetical protein
VAARRDIDRVIDLLTRNRRVDEVDLADATDLAQYLTKMTAADLRRLGTWLYFSGPMDEVAVTNAVRRLEMEEGE